MLLCYGFQCPDSAFVVGDLLVVPLKPDSPGGFFLPSVLQRPNNEVKTVHHLRLTSLYFRNVFPQTVNLLGQFPEMLEQVIRDRPEFLYFPLDFAGVVIAHSEKNITPQYTKRRRGKEMKLCNKNQHSNPNILCPAGRFPGDGDGKHGRKPRKNFAQLGLCKAKYFYLHSPLGIIWNNF
jgi:hypothetical protein